MLSLGEMRRRKDRRQKGFERGGAPDFQGRKAASHPDFRGLGKRGRRTDFRNHFRVAPFPRRIKIL